MYAKIPIKLVTFLYRQKLLYGWRVGGVPNLGYLNDLLMNLNSMELSIQVVESWDVKIAALMVALSKLCTFRYGLGSKKINVG